MARLRREGENKKERRKREIKNKVKSFRDTKNRTKFNLDLNLKNSNSIRLQTIKQYKAIGMNAQDLCDLILIFKAI